ncbi:MAG TPA: hypothetical protein VMW87_02150 [Spirochaetia bacterium]|nr:hypothetical protein [Spirochaetia bacterium]
MDTESLVLVVLAVVTGLLLFTLFRMRRGGYTFLSDHMATKTRNALEVLKPCPICHTMLKRGETVHSIVFGKKNEDTIAHLFGCPYCYPDNRKHARICPVCHKTLPAEGYLFARMFEKKGKRHVHVLGCTVCRMAGRNAVK